MISHAQVHKRAYVYIYASRIITYARHVIFRIRSSCINKKRRIRSFWWHFVLLLLAFVRQRQNFKCRRSKRIAAAMGKRSQHKESQLDSSGLSLRHDHQSTHSTAYSGTDWIRLIVNNLFPVPPFRSSSHSYSFYFPSRAIISRTFHLYLHVNRRRRDVHPRW